MTLMSIAKTVTETSSWLDLTIPQLATTLRDARTTLGDSLMRTLLDNPALMQCDRHHTDRMWAITIRLSSIIATLRVQEDGSDMNQMMCAQRPSGLHGVRLERTVPSLDRFLDEH
jgi:hypothetical protein